MKAWMLVIIAILLTGCAGWGPTKRVEVNVDQTIEVDGKSLEEYAQSGGKLPTFSQTIELNGIDFKSDTEQSKADTVTPRTTLPITYGDGQTTAGGTDLTNQPAKPITDSFNPVDNSSKTDNVNNASVKPETTAPVVETGELIEEVPLSIYMDCSSEECKPTNKIWSWTKQKCDAYGGPIVVNIPECGVFFVEDPCEMYTPSGNPNDFSSWVWFPGLASKQKDTHPLGFASVFSKPGCTTPVTATITRK